MAVTFDSYNSKAEWNLDYLHKKISAPKPKTVSVNIPLVHGDIDLTNRLAGNAPIFENRELSFYFEIRSLRLAWIRDYQAILEKIHGRIMNVYLDEDPGFYWRGRVTVGNLEDHGATAGFEVKVDAFPFKWSRTPESILTYSSVGTTNATIDIVPDIALPVFTVVNNLEITYNSQVFVATSIISTPPGLMFKQGTNQALKLVGTGAVTVDIYGGYL